MCAFIEINLICLNLLEFNLDVLQIVLEFISLLEGQTDKNDTNCKCTKVFEQQNLT